MPKVFRLSIPYIHSHNHHDHDDQNPSPSLEEHLVSSKIKNADLAHSKQLA
jgi:hypothetical protein